MPYTRFLRTDHVVTDLKSQTLDEAVVEILREIAGKNPDLDLQTLTDSVLARERMRSTALDNGVALPHAQTDAARRPMVLIGRSKSGLAVSDPLKNPVHLVFMVLS
ncbi:MAG: PTS sugar transporter subunit IIA, partial [Desulfuromonadaceae bacterium]|nr:PTS sugar transporter subunit IIA [Desulfuromonadaceae bacterium]